MTNHTHTHTHTHAETQIGNLFIRRSPSPLWAGKAGRVGDGDESFHWALGTEHPVLSSRASSPAAACASGETRLGLILKFWLNYSPWEKW